MALRLPKQDYRDIERVIEFDFVRATEAAALNALRWLGRGDKEAADAAACDAIRGMFDLMDICGEVVIGEGIKDNAPGIFKGEQLGTWIPVRRTSISRSIRSTARRTFPRACRTRSVASRRRARGRREGCATRYSLILHVEAGVRSGGDRIHEEARRFAPARHADRRDAGNRCARGGQARAGRGGDDARPAATQEIVEQIRAAGASLRMIGDGDIAAAIAPSLPDPDVDLYMGIGGSPEAVLAAAAIKCLGGDMQCRMWPRDEKERKSLIADGYEKDLDRVYSADDLAHGQNIIFCATGISDSALLPGVRARGGVTAITHSILMRVKSKTVRFIRARHNLQTKTIRLRSDNREHIL